MLSLGTKKADKLRARLMAGAHVPKFPPTETPAEEEEKTRKAKEHKDKLLGYDKSR